MDGFAVLAEPTRRSIVDRLRTGESDVNGLVAELRISQTLLSKHLRVLRDAGVVAAETVGRRRVYRLAERPLPDVVAWIAPYAEMWSASLDRLAHAMDADADTDTDTAGTNTEEPP